MQISAIYELMGGDGLALYDYAKKSSSKNIINEAIKEYSPDLHDVADRAKRPDKSIFVPNGEFHEDTKKPVYVKDISPVSRAPLAFQKYIISQKASFARGNGVIFKPTNEKSKIYERVWSNWQRNKTDFDLKEIAERQMGETQVALILYGERGAETLDDFLFKYKIVSPLKGDKLTPFFDEDTDDLMMFAREYKRGKDNRYDLYLMNESGLCDIYKYKNGKDLDVINTQYTKLPIIFWEQLNGECYDTKDLINEFEFGFNDFLTGLGYTADPILFAKGEVMDLPPKGSAGKFIESSDPNGDLKYITPDNATEARALQFQMLQKYIFSLNRAVLLDLDTMTKLGTTSGAALERYLIDAYMEATDRQQGSWGKGVQRIVNWLVSQWSLLEGEEKGFRIDLEFTKYSMQDALERVELAVKANGGKPVIDLEGGVSMAGLVDDVTGTVAKIKEEGSISAPPLG